MSTYTFKKKTTSAGLSLAVAATLINPIIGVSTASAQTDPQFECGDVHIVRVEGTGAINPKKGQVKLPDGSFVNTSGSAQGQLKEIVDVSRQNNPNVKITETLLDYPAAVGAVGSANPLLDNSQTYGLSRLTGDMNGLKHIAEYNKKCSDTMFAFTGFSQGASVAGDLSALIANGAIDGVGADRILGAILVADPGKSGLSEFSGPGENQNTQTWIPFPQDSQVFYNRNGEYATEEVKDTVGWTGQRSLPFKDIEGRVISIAHPEDTAAVVGTDSPLRALADISDKDIWPNYSYRHGTSLGRVVMNNQRALMTLLPIAFNVMSRVNSTDPSTNSFDDVFKEAQQRINDMQTVSDVDKGVLLNAIHEVEKVIDLIQSDKMYDIQDDNDKAAITYLITDIYPLISDQIDNIPEITLPTSVPLIGDTIDSATVRNLADTMYNNAQAYRENNPDLFPDKPEAKEAFDQLLKFVPNHGSYFSSYQIDGKRALDWAADAMSAGIKNYKENTPITLDAGDNRSNETLEIAEPDRADDGLKSLLNYLEKGTSVLGEDIRNIPVPSDGRVKYNEDAPTEIKEENDIENPDEKPVSDPESDANDNKIIADIIKELEELADNTGVENTAIPDDEKTPSRESDGQVESTKNSDTPENTSPTSPSQKSEVEDVLQENEKSIHNDEHQDDNRADISERDTIRNTESKISSGDITRESDSELNNGDDATRTDAYQNEERNDTQVGASDNYNQQEPISSVQYSDQPQGFAPIVESDQTPVEQRDARTQYVAPVASRGIKTGPAVHTGGAVVKESIWDKVLNLFR